MKKRALLGLTVGTVGIAGLIKVIRDDNQDALTVEDLAGLEPQAPIDPSSLEGASDSLVGDSLLALPRGFSYRAYSATGQRLSDGYTVPGAHDGMCAFGSPVITNANHIHLVRNHELGESRFPLIEEYRSRHRLVTRDDHLKWDTAIDAGGTTTLVVDRTDGTLIDHFASLSGTLRNCNGGPTPWGSWLSCEENTDTPATNSRLSEKHGYCFEVPAANKHITKAIPIKAMGRFNREGCALDQDHTVYMTEDKFNSCLYRFVPYQKPNKLGDLNHGGRLFALRVRRDTVAPLLRGQLPGLVSKNPNSVDARGDMRAFLNKALKIDWVPISNPDPDDDSVRDEAQDKGAALFASGEGIWHADNRMYFSATSGGTLQQGQIWEIDISKQTLKLLVEPSRPSVLTKPDALTTGLDGTLYVAEDTTKSRVVAINNKGIPITILRNALNTYELSGPCFSPDGRFFFVNLQRPGVTCCVFKNDYSPIMADDWIT